MGHCAHCHAELPPQTKGRPRRYCDSACRLAAYEKRWEAREGLTRNRYRYWMGGKG